MLTEGQQRQYDEEGYFIVDDAVEAAMLPRLRAAAERVKESVRQGEVDVYADFRGEGEPFHIQGLLSPAYGEPTFGEYMASENLLRYVRAQVGDKLRLAGGLGMFTNPRNQPFNMGWHRDVGHEPRDLPEEAELEFLRRPRRECRWELALVDDVSLVIVPGSHLRYRTEREWEVMSNNLNESLPGELVVEFKAGHTIFWNGKVIHRSVQVPDTERLTLVSAFSIHQEDDAKTEVGRFSFMLEEGVRESLPKALLPYYDNWRSVQTV